MSAHIEISGLSKWFDDVEALRSIDLQIHENEFVSIVGASGCGKTTLLSIIAGLTEQTEGSVVVDGMDVTGPGRDRGVVFQQFTLLPWLTAQGNVEFALEPEKLSKAERAERARTYLQLVGLEGFENSYPNQLSGGMQQRVAIARSLSYHPAVLLMDEPFGALDALTRREMQALLTRVWERERITVVMVTHDIEEAIITSDRIVVLSPRPGQVAEIIDVDLPRPRTEELVDVPEFRALHRRVMGLIHSTSAK